MAYSEALSDQAVAISVSESPDLGALGMGGEGGDAQYVGGRDHGGGCNGNQCEAFSAENAAADGKTDKGIPADIGLDD